MARDQFTVGMTCPHCQAVGAVAWEENSNAGPSGPQRRLVSVHGDFHAETGRTESGDPVIVCNSCDTIQSD